MRRTGFNVVVGLTVIFLCTSAGSGQTQYGWQPGFEYPDWYGLDSLCRALTVFDDGTGPALYAGGYFIRAGGVLVNFIAKWDGTGWTPLGQG